MKEKTMLYNSENDKWYTKEEVINNIMEQGYNEEEAESHLEYSIKHNILYTIEGYNKYFKPYEN